MSENKYEQRVREIAEEMSKELHPIPWTVCRKELTEYYLPLARIAVKHIADTAERFYQHGWLRGKKGLPVATEEEIELDFIASGLIPTPERKEAGEV